MPMIGAGCTHLDRFDKASYESFNGQLSPTCAKRCPRCEAPLEAKDMDGRTAMARESDRHTRLAIERAVPEAQRHALVDKVMVPRHVRGERVA